MAIVIVSVSPVIVRVFIVGTADVQFHSWSAVHTHPGHVLVFDGNQHYDCLAGLVGEDGVSLRRGGVKENAVHMWRFLSLRSLSRKAGQQRKGEQAEDRGQGASKPSRAARRA